MKTMNWSDGLSGNDRNEYFGGQGLDDDKPIKFITDHVTIPDWEDFATNYFQDERSVKAGIQLQRDAWNAAVQTIVEYINKKGMVEGKEIEMLLQVKGKNC